MTSASVKRLLLHGVIIFEIITGVVGIAWVLAGITGIIPSATPSTLLYGLFPLLSLSAGFLLWRRWRHALGLSLLVLSLQVPVIRTQDFSLNLAAPFNLTVSGIWNAPGGANAILFGINVLALGVLLVLFWCNPVLRGVTIREALFEGPFKRNAR